jgi:hypothetical protein
MNSEGKKITYVKPGKIRSEALNVFVSLSTSPQLKLENCLAHLQAKACLQAYHIWVTGG